MLSASCELDGKIYLSERASARLLGTLAGRKASQTESPVEQLSDREREVFELIGRGLMRREIARRLHLSVRTIDTYRGRLKVKLNLRSSADVVRVATAWVEKL
jgi:DNA-binding NarL/FixJ family response regulator